MASLDLPVVDMTHIHSAAHPAFVEKLGGSLERYGFVAVTGHGIEPALLNEAYAQAELFFALPDEEKRTYEDAARGRQRGYTGFGIERSKDSSVADLKEFWMVGRRLGAEHPLVTSGLMLDNTFPTQPTGFAEVFSELYDRLDAFANQLLAAICEHVGLDVEELLGAVAEGNSTNRIIHYPPVGESTPPGAVRAAAHEDINLLTVLPASTQPGLELLDRSTGEWRAIVTPPDVMICDTGDIMQRLTSGRLPATTHRVVNPVGTRNVSRLSMPFFVHPRPDWVIRSAKGDAPPITAGAFLEQRLIANGVIG